MLRFIGSFSNSLLLVLFVWPFIAWLLTLPVLLGQYLRFHKVYLRRVVAIYLFFLYFLALLAFTLYPLPDNPEIFCGSKHLSPQLNPLQFLWDIKDEGSRAILQIGANIVFFIPLGVFLRNLFGRKFRGVILLSLATSLFLETAQLTGAFGYYPCTYRLFDINDLAWNVLGAGLGLGLGRFLPNFSQLKKRTGLNFNPGAIQRLVIFMVDNWVSGMLALMIISPLYFLGLPWRQWWWVAYLACFMAVQFAGPFFFHGKTIFGGLTGVSLDDQDRRGLKRVLFYGLRALILGGIVFNQAGVRGILMLVVAGCWAWRKKMPYKIVDKL